MKKPTICRVWATPRQDLRNQIKTDSKGAAAKKVFRAFLLQQLYSRRHQKRCVRRSLASAGAICMESLSFTMDVGIPDPIDPEIIFKKGLIYKIIFFQGTERRRIARHYGGLNPVEPKIFKGIMDPAFPQPWTCSLCQYSLHPACIQERPRQKAPQTTFVRLILPMRP